ncbi:MAG: hypothetical protein E6Q31_09860 [Aquabacterium sp.]|nr:MAG: hypothetical protein E6Q31_09860 [Aquabacterium sp.]
MNLPLDSAPPAGGNWLSGRMPVFLIGLLLLLLLGLSELLLKQVQLRREATLRQQVGNQAGELRARLLNELNGTLHLPVAWPRTCKAVMARSTRRPCNPGLKA